MATYCFLVKQATRPAFVLMMRPSVLTTLAAVLLAGCGAQVTSTDAEIAALTRIERPVSGEPGRRVSALRAGDEALPRVIYVHGTPGDATGWADYLTRPVPGMQAIAIDRLGFGKSVTGVSAEGKARRSVVTSYAEQAEAIEPFLECRGGAWPILVGHSLGGPIVCQAAAMYPERVGGVVVLAGSLDPSLEKPEWYNYGVAFGLWNWAVPRSIDNSNEEIFAGREQTSLLAPVLAKIRCPVTIIHGEDDKLVPVANVEYMRRMLTGASRLNVVQIGRQGHFLPWEQADTVRRAIGDMRHELSRGAGGRP